MATPETIPPARTPSPSPEPSLRRQSRGLRWLLAASGILVLFAGVQLFVFAERTDEYFAWTVLPPVGAAFLGAGYFAAVAMEWLSIRERLWVSARLVAVTILVFASLTTAVTIAHLDRFHFAGPTTATVAVTWVWMLIYVAVPPLMALCLLAQRRAPGADPPRRARVGPWFKAVFCLHALVMLAVGAPLLVAPVATAEAVWPWELTPLTGRAVAAWLLGMGFAGLAGVLAEDDWGRLWPMVVSFAVLSILQLIVVVRYAGALDWGGVRAWVYLVYLLDMAALSAFAVARAHTARRAPAAAA